MVEFSYFNASPEVFSIAVGVALFAVSNYILVKFLRNKATSLIVALVFSMIAAWSLYENDFYGWESTLAILIYIVVAVLFLKILWVFVKSFKRSWGG